MPVYLFSPRAPLLFRQGRPFGGSDLARSLPFPRPDTLAGALRAVWVDQKRETDSVGVETSMWNEAQKLAVQGPLLVERRLDGRRLRFLVPRPADAAYLREGAKEELAPLVPHALSSAEGTDLEKGLWPLLAQTTGISLARAKPLPGPLFWYLDRLEQWLTQPNGQKLSGLWNSGSDDRKTFFSLGVDALPTATRPHLGVDRATQAAEEGQFFQTEGLDFGPRRALDRADRSPKPVENPDETYEYGLLTQCGAELPEGFRRLGGRSRLAHLARMPDELWPSRCPDRLRAALARAPGIRLLLLTPAVFKEGWRPGWLEWNQGKNSWCGTPPGFSAAEMQLCLRGVALAGWEPASGWDGQAGRPAALKRVAPAGSVYWFTVEAGQAELHRLWASSLSDDEPDRNTGFGLAVPGVWAWDESSEFRRGNTP